MQILFPVVAMFRDSLHQLEILETASDFHFMMEWNQLKRHLSFEFDGSLALDAEYRYQVTTVRHHTQGIFSSVTYTIIKTI